jgi:hypothetical protein
MLGSLLFHFITKQRRQKKEQQTQEKEIVDCINLENLRDEFANLFVAVFYRSAKFEVCVPSQLV